MLRKMSIIPVALVATYLFANGESQVETLTQTGQTLTMATATEVITQIEQTPTMAIAEVETKTMQIAAVEAANSENKTVSEQDEEIHLYARVAVKPLFNGGDAEKEFREYAQSKVVYPAEAKEKRITGRVFIEFTIDKDGSLTNVKVVRGVDPLLDAEALRIIRSSPKWTPGKHGGKEVKVLYTFPFYFQLTEPTSTNTETKTVSEGDEEIHLYARVAVKPLFNGGDAEKGFREWVMSNTVYPAEAKENGITGRVFIEFTIDKDGSVTDVKLMRGVDPLLDAEALRVIRSSPKWTPGKHGGKLVKVKYTFPLYFQLDN